jgi:hypothetical protein
MAFALTFDVQFFIPFLFILAVTLGALTYAKVFTSPVRAVVAIALAMFASVYTPFTHALWNWLPGITWFFIFMFMLAFIMKLFGIGEAHHKRPPTETLIIGGFALLLLFSIGFALLQYAPFEIPFIGGGDSLLLVIGIIFIGALFLIAARVKGEEKGG